MSNDLLLKIARVDGLLGFALLIISSFGGVLMSTRIAQRRKLFKGQTFRYHRKLSLIGASLFILHPIPLLFAYHISGLAWWNIFVPFSAPKQTILIAWGSIAGYVLIIVTVSSLYIKKIPRKQWRLMHYGSYVVLILGLIHSLTISNEFNPNESFRVSEPDKFLLAFLALPLILILPISRLIITKQKNKVTSSIILLFILLLPAVVSKGAVIAYKHRDVRQTTSKHHHGSHINSNIEHQYKAQSIIRTAPVTKAPSSRFSGNFLTTFNGSLLGSFNPSMNERLTLDYALPKGQILDLRIENYYEGSYNENPPGDLVGNINEHKLEIQGTYTYPFNKMFSISPAILHHDNFRFHDTYYWGILTLTAKFHLSPTVTITPNISGEFRLSGGRIFYDTNTSLDYHFAKHWIFEATYHRYENEGELDPAPTEKEEQEYGFIYLLPHGQSIGLSYFHHIQHGSANDQFAFIHLKYGISF